ncbi:MAG TPA: GNAT family N-acetyltransferase [Nannocystaceae bacterium]|nr:GNAT family N-acetyltransferase [Nannocystaceae bacterium]
MTDLRVQNLTRELARPCADLELRCFPHANPDQLIGEADLLAYARVFPEGFFVVLDGDRVVGQAGGIFITDFDFDHPEHTIVGLTGEHQCGNHDPRGAWYYGTDMAVDPAYRRRGIGHMLYDLRKDLVRRHRRRGILAGASLPGFAHHKARMSAPEYIARVARGELHDPTLSFQIQNGFRVVCPLPGYLEDTATDSWGALIRWDNPDLA